MHRSLNSGLPLRLHYLMATSICRSRSLSNKSFLGSTVLQMPYFLFQNPKCGTCLRYCKNFTFLTLLLLECKSMAKTSHQVRTNKQNPCRLYSPCWHVLRSPCIVPLQSLVKGERMKFVVQITTPAATQSALLSCTKAKCCFLQELREQGAGYIFSLLGR